MQELRESDWIIRRNDLLQTVSDERGKFLSVSASKIDPAQVVRDDVGGLEVRSVRTSAPRLLGSLTNYLRWRILAISTHASFEL